jgi:hypothetical protein
LVLAAGAALPGERGDLVGKRSDEQPGDRIETKWLPVAITDSATSGPHSSASAFAHRCSSAAATATPIANARPTWRLGTAA